MGYREDEIRKLRKEITLSDSVEQKIQEAYSQIKGKEDVKYILYKKRRKVVVTAAVCVAVLGTTLTAMATSGFFTKFTKYNQGTVTYQFDIDYDLVPGEYTVIAEYIPEGYVNQETEKCSYGKEDNKEYFTILPIISTVDLDKQNSVIQEEGVEDVEHTTLSGMEADIITYQEKDKYEKPTNIYLFNPQEGYVIWVYGSYKMPVEELKKVADSLVVTKTGDSEESYLSEQEKKLMAEKQQNVEQVIAEYREKGVPLEQIVPLGESFTYPSIGYNGYTEEFVDGNVESYTFSIEDVEIVEKMTKIHPEELSDYEEKVAPWLNADGSLKSYTRLRYGRNGELLEEETVEQCFLKVKVKLIYSFDEEKAEQLSKVFDNSVDLNASLVRLGEKNGEKYEYAMDYYEAVPSEHNQLQVDYAAIGLSEPQYYEDETQGRKQFFFKTMKDGQILEYELLFVIDKDLLEGNVVLSFNEAGNPGTIYSNTTKESYFAIKE